jgi:membrane fusion protein, multidrug efflux system
MAKRMVLMLVGIAVFVSAIGFVKVRQVQAGMAQYASFQPPPEAVTTTIAKAGNWQATLSAIGTVAPVQGVTISADLPGIVDKITFSSGERVREGDVLVQLDSRQEQAQLAALTSKRDLARLSLDRIRGLLAKKVSSQAEFDAAEAEFRQADANVGEIQATIARKTIRAPFSGVLGIRAINLGQYLTSGQPIVPLQSNDPIYVNFSVPQQQIRDVPGGAEVRVTADGSSDVLATGKISAIESVIDATTRNIQVQATFENHRGRLRPGMFVKTEVMMSKGSDIVPIPSSSILYAPYGDSVFVVEDMKGKDGATYKGVRQQFVKTGGSRGDQVSVLSGIKPGEEIVTSGVFKLRNLGAVLVNNEIKISDDPKPTPEDN